jgi:putative mRNA 3-end processing factor
MPQLIELKASGLYCAAGDFYIDPWQPVARALITHAHGDHARAGSEKYFCATPGRNVLLHRIGRALGHEKAQEVPKLPDIQSFEYGQVFEMGGVKISFHPAGHILGSSQVRLELNGEVWVFSGDYKRDPDPTCAPFEVVKCDTFITESTFGLPVYHWQPTHEVAKDILHWWDECIAEKKTAILFCYALGKTQRIMAELARIADREVLLHGAMMPLTRIYEQERVPVGKYRAVSEFEKGANLQGALVIAPPSAGGGPWMRRFPQSSSAFASGWMQIRGNRRRNGYDRGFVVSDHCDWKSLVRTVQETGAKKVYVTHGDGTTLSRYLQEKGIDAEPLKTSFEGETDRDAEMGESA